MEWAKRIPHFSELPLDDQVILLRAGEWLGLAGVGRFQEERGRGWSPRDSTDPRTLLAAVVWGGPAGWGSCPSPVPSGLSIPSLPHKEALDLGSHQVVFRDVKSYPGPLGREG